MPETIATLAFTAWRITPKTVWSFVEAVTADGVRGLGEATLGGREAEMMGIARRLSDTVIGADITNPDALEARLPFGDIASAAVSSAIMPAVWDAKARAAGQPLCEALSGAQRQSVPAYANINRRTLDRSPTGFAASVRDAVAAGYTAFKIAPFDDLSAAMPDAEANPLIEAGIARTAAVREAIGPDARLMVDCHWRFNEASARRCIDGLKGLNLHWFECPIAESVETLDALKRLRAHANAAGMRLTGLEMEIRCEGFRPFLEAGAYDVMMPDTKYAGGPAEMLRIAEKFGRFGVEFSPHNPSGPICHAQSLHIALAAPTLDALELQFDETPLFDALVGKALPEAKGGAFAASDAGSSSIGAAFSIAATMDLESVAHWHSNV